MIPRHRYRLLALGLLAVQAVSGCYSLAEPSFKPGDARDVFAAIVRRGVLVSEPIAGQIACDDAGMIPNTLYVSARMPGETEPRDVYIHTYREKRWEEGLEEVDACQADYAAAHPGSHITRLDIPIYRVFGADWSPELARELQAAFEEAARAG